MPTKPALIARAAELQKRHPYFTKRDIQILMDIEAEDAREVSEALKCLPLERTLKITRLRPVDSDSLPGQHLPRRH